MSRCDDLRNDALAWAALPSADPERVAVAEHARVCSGCGDALRTAERTLGLLDRCTLPPPSDEALARARAAVLAEWDPAPAVAQRAPRDWIAVTIAVFVVLLAFLFLKRRFVTAALLPAALGLGGFAVLMARGAARRGWAFIGYGLSGSLLFALAAWLVSDRAIGQVARSGVPCGVFELTASIAPLATAAWVAFRRGKRSFELVAGGALAGAMAGQAALHIGCPSRALLHVLVFHSGAVFAAALVGAAVARLLPARGAPAQDG